MHNKHSLSIFSLKPTEIHTHPNQGGLDDLVAMAGCVPPDPIPNSDVKNPSAYDTVA